MISKSAEERLKPTGLAGNPPQVTRQKGYLHLPSNSRLLSPEPDQGKTRLAIFLDRDGVLVDEVHFLREPSQLNIPEQVYRSIETLLK